MGRRFQFDVPGQQLLQLLQRVCCRDMFQYMQQVGLRIQAMHFGSFDQRVPGGAGMSTFAGIGKQPVLAANGKGALTFVVYQSARAEAVFTAGSLV